MENVLTPKNRFVKDVICNRRCLIMCVICLVSAGCNIPKIEKLSFNTSPDEFYASDKVRVYDSFEQISEPYIILGNNVAYILPAPSSTADKRTRALIESVGKIGANSVVGIYHLEAPFITMHPSTTGIAVLARDGLSVINRDRPKFIVKILPVIWRAELREERDVGKMEEYVLKAAQYKLYEKKYYANIVADKGSYTVSDLEQMSTGELIALFGKETDYLLTLEILHEGGLGLIITEFNEIIIRASLFSLRDSKVEYTRDGKSFDMGTGIVLALTTDLEYNVALGATREALKDLPRVKVP